VCVRVYIEPIYIRAFDLVLTLPDKLFREPFFVGIFASMSGLFFHMCKVFFSIFIVISHFVSLLCRVVFPNT